MSFQFNNWSTKDLYNRKDTNLVLSRVAMFYACNRAKIKSFILKCLENS